MSVKKTIIVLIFASVILFFSSTFCSAEKTNVFPELLIFHSPSCHKCIEAKVKVLPLIEKEFRDRVSFVYLDVTEIENYKILLSLKEKYKQADNLSIPIFFLNGNFFNGTEVDLGSLSKFIQNSLFNPQALEPVAPVDLFLKFKTFTLFAIVGVALVDGINPCAFTVIVFFISFLALQGYRKKELIVIGSSFITAVFLTYLLIGLGVFSFLYRMSNFWVFTKIFNILVGIFSIIIAVFALADFIKFKLTGETQNLSLQLPQPVKNQIHKIIGLHFRINKNVSGAKLKRPIFKLALTALITGFIVSLLEAVCTGQTYLPTITFILKTTDDLKGLALFYLLVYNYMFVLPLILIFIFALKGATSENFAGFIKKHMILIKSAMAVIFLILGIYLIWRA